MTALLEYIDLLYHISWVFIRPCFCIFSNRYLAILQCNNINKKRVEWCSVKQYRLSKIGMVSKLVLRYDYSVVITCNLTFTMQ